MDENILTSLFAHGRYYAAMWHKDVSNRDVNENKYFAIQALYADLTDKYKKTPYSEFNGYCGVTVRDGRIINDDYKDYEYYPDSREE